MADIYEHTDDVAILRQRIEELSRIRQGYAAHLGSSLYDATKDMDDLRWGRESLYDGIAACDAEREAILTRICDLEAVATEPAVAEAEEPAAVEPEPEEPVEEPEAEEPAAVEPEPEEPVEEPVAEEPEAEEPVDVLAPEPVQAAEPVAAPEPNPYELAELDEDDEEEDYDEDVEDFASDDGLFVVPEPELYVYEEGDPFAIGQRIDSTHEIPVPETVEATQDELACPTCGAPVAPEDMFCMTCGTSLANLHASAEPEPAYVPEPVQVPEPPAQQEQAPVCPVCGAMGEPGNKFCMECGSSLAQAAAPTPAPRASVCPACGSPIDHSFKFCMTCGHRLV